MRQIYPWLMPYWQPLQQRLAEGRLPHGMLLTGMDGIGKREFGLALLEATLCQHPSTAPCGQCKACQLVYAGTHPDLLLVEPEEEGKAIRIDQIREIAKFLSQTAQQGGRKALMIAPAEAMNKQAANALLKSLEEPGGEVLMVLITSAPSRLLATVRSRCQKLVFTRPQQSLALPWLEKSLGSDAEQYLSEACGAPLKALAEFRADVHAQRLAIAKKFVQLIEANLGVIEFAKDLASQDNAISDSLMLWLNECVSQKLGQQGCKTKPGEIVTAGFAQHPVECVFDLYQQLLTVKRLLLSSANPNPQLLWESCLLPWQRSLNTN